jgi:polyphosphate kinase
VAPLNLDKKLRAPDRSRSRACQGRPPVAFIVAKVNSLLDPDIIEALYRASRAGVQIELIVREPARCVPGCAA